jgi:hypothetical protein
MYSFVKWIMEDSDFTQEQKLKATKDIKRDIRRVMCPINTDLFEETVHYRDEYGESCYTKEFFEQTFSDEDKEEFIKDQWRHICSPYDCTGLRFTTSIRIINFKEPNSFGARSVVYHFMGLDV